MFLSYLYCVMVVLVFFFILRVFVSREILAISLFVLPLSHLVSALFLFVLSLSYSRRVPFHFHY